jgi:prolycopene isomerase
VLYACVDRRVIPEDTLPVEMLAGNPDVLDENEVTVYLPSIDDHTLCPEDSHIAIAIGPSFERWDILDETAYLRKKEEEKLRLISLLEKRFPGFESGLRYSEAATPRTIERYTMKKKGAVAGPKQMLGQHLFHRLHTRSDWDTLFCCGESTVMGTGTPAVTVSGLSAANAILKKLGQQPYVYCDNMKNYVRIVEKPYPQEDRFSEYYADHRDIMLKAAACQYCERPACSPDLSVDVRGVMRRLAVGNFAGAKRAAERMGEGVDVAKLAQCERNCILNAENGHPVEIRAVFSGLAGMEMPIKGNRL